MLTERQVRAAVYKHEGNSWDVRWDSPDGVPGFGVRVYPSGRKSYVVLLRVAGRRRTYTIGPTSTLSLKEARTRAKRLSLKAADGIDPLADRQRARSVESLSDLALRYLEEHALAFKTKRSWQDDARRLGFRWDDASNAFVDIDYTTQLPGGRRRRRSEIRDRLGSTKITSVESADVRALHRHIGRSRGPYEANRQQELLRSIFNFAIGEGILPRDAENPARAWTRTDPGGVKRYQERARDRYVEPDEMQRFAEAVAEETDMQVKAVVWLAVLSGARKTELLARRWRDVDESHLQLCVGYDKGGRLAGGNPKPIYKSLPREAVEVLRSLPTAPLGDDGKLMRSDDWIFPSPSGSASGHRVEIRTAWTRIRRRSGLLADTEDKSHERRSLTFHDLRRTAGSWLASSGYGTRLIGDILGHQDIRTTERYAHLHQPEKQAALSNSTSKILAAAGATSGTALVNGPTGDSKQKDRALSTEGEPDVASSTATPEELRAAGDSLLELAERQAREREETRFRAIDLLTRAEKLESGR